MLDVEPVLGVIAVDSVPLFRAGLASVVSRLPDARWLGGSDSEPAAIALCRWWQPDIALVESSMDAGGLFMRDLRVTHGVRWVVALVDLNASALNNAAAALRAGAHAVVARSADDDLLVKAIRSVRATQPYVDKRVVRIAPPLRGYNLPGGVVTERERQVLHLAAAGLSSSQMGAMMHCSAETVRTHLKHAMGKLRARNRSHVVAVAFRYGLLDREPFCL